MDRSPLSDAGLSYTHSASNVPLIGSTIGDAFDRVVESYPEHEALVSLHQDLRYTYRQLQAEVDRFARGLMALGMRKGERVGIWSPNHAQWVVTQFATAKIGAILVTINPAYRVHELEYALNQAACAALIIAPPLKSTDYASLLGDLAPELPLAEPGQLQAARLALRPAFSASCCCVKPAACRWWRSRSPKIDGALVVSIRAQGSTESSAERYPPTCRRA
jgi:fatty-acyl-CoA synthase